MSLYTYTGLTDKKYVYKYIHIHTYELCSPINISFTSLTDINILISALLPTGSTSAMTRDFSLNYKMRRLQCWWTMPTVDSLTHSICQRSTIVSERQKFSMRRKWLKLVEVATVCVLWTCFGSLKWKFLYYTSISYYFFNLLQFLFTNIIYYLF